MKKILACLLAVVLGLSCLTGCKKPAAEKTSYLNEAKSYIRAMYKDVAEKTTMDFSRISQVTISGKTYPITWTVEVTEGDAEVKISEPVDNKVTFTVPEAKEVEIKFTVTATVSEGEESASTSFNYYIPAVEKAATKFVGITSAKAGTYLFAIGQANLGKTLYFTGAMSGEYFATSQNMTDAAYVTVEQVEGGYTLSFVKDGATKYIGIYKNGNGKIRPLISDEPVVFTWNEEACVFITNIEGTDYYLGTYNTYNTFSASATSYILGDNLAKIGVSQFPGQLGYVDTPVAVAEWKAGNSYKFALIQANLGQTLYFNGNMSGEYLATTPDFMQAVSVTVEEVDGGYALSFVKDGATKYIGIYKNGNGKIRPLISDEAVVFTWNADAKTFVASVEGADYYLGTYNTYNTFSASATSYILGDNLAKIGSSQFPSFLVDVTVPTVAMSAATAGTYFFALNQANLGQTLFFTGALSGEYLATSTDVSKAVAVTVEEVDGGFTFSFMKDGATKYIGIYKNDNGKIRPLISDAPVVFTWNDDAKVFITSVEGADYYLGTYNTYNTFSASATSYILGDNLAKIGVSQFPGQFVVIGF